MAPKSRREFIELGAGAGICGALSLSGCRPNKAKTAKHEPAVDEQPLCGPSTI